MQKLRLLNYQIQSWTKQIKNYFSKHIRIFRGKELLKASCLKLLR